MSLQQYPICWECARPVEYNHVYDSICGHDVCPSLVFHGICLMQWREKREEIERRIHQFIMEHPVIFRDDIEDLDG